MKEEERYCGECCWFYAEDTYGYGMCPFRFADVHECGQKCDVPLKYVSRKEMRHHMAVLLQWERYMSDRSELALYRAPSLADRNKAMKFAYKYMKVFSEL